MSSQSLNELHRQDLVSHPLRCFTLCTLGDKQAQDTKKKSGLVKYFPIGPCRPLILAIPLQGRVATHIRPTYLQSGFLDL